MNVFDRVKKTARVGLARVAFMLVLLTTVDGAAAEVRIKDVTRVAGAHVNTVDGVGLVMGLNGTGGRDPRTREAALNLMQRFGMRASEDVRNNIRDDSKLRTDNMSIVWVSAKLPATARIGGPVSVTVAAMDDATSLQGGELITTPLFGADGEVYVVASGAVLSVDVREFHVLGIHTVNSSSIRRVRCWC